MSSKGMQLTEIGLIPEDWEVKSIGDFTIVTSGGTPSTDIKDFWSGNIPWANSGELNKYQIHYTDNFISQLGLEKSSTKLIPVGCILIGLAGQGKTRGTVARNKISLCINQSIGAVLPSKDFCSDYLFYNLQNRYKELRGMSTGDGGRGGLNLKILESIKIPYPSFSEQQAIAKALSNIDSWIESLEKLIAKKQLIKQGAMQRLLTSKEGWVERKLGECLLQPPDYGINAPAVPYNQSLPVYLRITDITVDGKYSKENPVCVNSINAEKYFLNANDIVFARTGASVGKTYFHSDAKIKLVFAGFLIRVRANTEILHSEFFFHFTQSSLYWDWIRANSMRTGQPGINGNEYQELPIALPNVEEQIRIASLLSDMDLEIEASQKKLQKARQIKQGMMQQLLTGKTRLYAEPVNV